MGILQIEHLEDGVGLHILVDIFGIVGAEPQLTVHLIGKDDSIVSTSFYAVKYAQYCAMVTCWKRLEFSVLILPCGFIGDGLHHIPVLGDLAVFHAPQIIIAGRCAAKGSFTDTQYKVSLCKYLMGGGVDHLDALTGKSGKSRAQPGKTICDTGVVLDVSITVKVVGGLFGVLALHHVDQEIFHQLAVLPSLVQIFQFLRPVNLGVAGGIRRGFHSQVVPMLCNHPVFIKAEDVKRHLFAGAGKVVNGL